MTLAHHDSTFRTCIMSTVRQTSKRPEQNLLCVSTNAPGCQRVTQFMDQNSPKDQWAVNYEGVEQVLSLVASSINHVKCTLNDEQQRQ